MNKNEMIGSRFDEEVICNIKHTSEEFFREFFPRHKDTQALFLEVEKLTGDFMAKRLNTLETLGDDDVHLMANEHPIVHVATAEWKSGGLFKKTMKGVFFVLHHGIKSQDAAFTLAEFNAFLNANGLDNMTTVNWIGIAVSNLDLADLKRRIDNDDPLFFTNTNDWQSCDINYNLKSLSYDSANKRLVFKVEDRFFT